jgi:RNA polymerase sigma-70 factor (ECF subfamily)
MLRAHEPDLAPLVRRMAEGDQNALAALYDATSPLVYGLALRILPRHSSRIERTKRSA